MFSGYSQEVEYGPDYAFFVRDGDEFSPLPMANSHWSDSMISGSAVCSLLGDQLDEATATDGFRPARLTIDMFSPAKREPAMVTTTTVREGSRIKVTDAVMKQSDRVVARASVVQLKMSQPPPGETWARSDTPSPPPPDVAPDLHAPGLPYFCSGTAGWSQTTRDHQDSSRKRLWIPYMMPATADSDSWLARICAVAEATSLVVNWGSAGVGYINADVTVTLAREPHKRGLGLEADHHVTADGIAIGAATLFDEVGAFGVCTVAAVSNADRQVDFSGDKAINPDWSPAQLD